MGDTASLKIFRRQQRAKNQITKGKHLKELEREFNRGYDQAEKDRAWFGDFAYNGNENLEIKIDTSKIR